MCEIMEEIAKKEREEALTEAYVHAIKKIMSDFDVSAKRAMQTLEIDADEQEKYLNLLGLKS